MTPGTHHVTSEETEEETHGWEMEKKLTNTRRNMNRTNQIHSLDKKMAKT